MTPGSQLAEAFQEEAHARLSPSGSKKWFACSGSITLEEPIPNVATTYSDDGTCMHEVAAWCLTEHRRAKQRIGDYVAVSRPGEEPVRKVQFTEDMADLVQGYVDAMRLCSIGNAYWVEQRVDFSEFCGVPGQFGTADFIVFNDRDGELAVYDLKTGYTPVEVEGNSQLMTYALGTLAKLRDGDHDDLAGIEPVMNAFKWARRLRGIKTIRLGVYQPRVSEGVQESVITLEQLEEFAGTLRDKAERVEDAKREYGVIPMVSWNRLYLNQTPNDVECAFCRAKPTCPTANAALQEFMMDGFDEIIEGKVEPVQTLHNHLAARDELNDIQKNDLLNKLMKLAPFVEDMILAVRAEVERRLLAGEEMPDFGLDTGRKGARKFIDEEEAEQLLNKQMRISRDHIYTFKLKSPTQLEKLTKPDDATSKPVLGEKQWMKVAKLVTQSDPKPTVKPKAAIKNPYTVPKPTNDGFEAVPPEDDEQLY
jgi:hypothetical protein